MKINHVHVQTYQNNIRHKFLLRCLSGLFSLLLVLLLYAQSSAVSISRPYEDAGPTLVKVLIHVLDVDDVQTADQSFHANVYVDLTWHDPRLTHENANSVTMDLNEVWHPNIQFLNQQKVWSTIPDMVQVSPGGEVRYSMRVWGAFSQPLDLHDFPFDKQAFTIQLVEAVYSIDELILEQDQEIKSSMSKVLSLPDWEILGWNVESKPYRASSEYENASGFSLTFLAKRHTGHFIVKVILPLILIVAMSWVVFWIDPQEIGSQLNVSVTTMLTLIAYRFAVGRDLPHVSYLTSIDYFILGATFLVFFSLIEVVIISSLAKNNNLPMASAIDRWSRVLFPLSFVLLSADALYYRILL
jgi:hypothetical protein